MFNLGELHLAIAWFRASVDESPCFITDWRVSLACDQLSAEKRAHRAMSGFRAVASLKRKGRAQRRAERVSR